MAFARRPPPLSSEGIVRLVKDFFPFKHVEELSVKELVGYDDRNYYFRANLSVELPQYPSQQTIHITSTNEYVLKVLNRRDSEKIEAVEMLVAIKKFLYSKGLNVPFPIPSLKGSEIVTLKEPLLYDQYADHKEIESNSDYTSLVSEDHYYQVRVLTFIPGGLVHDIEQTPLVLFKLGSYLATMHTNLKSFSHPGALKRKFLEWDLQHLLTIRYLIPKGIKDPVKLQMVTKILDDFERHVVPNIPQLPHCVVHNDFNDNNIIASLNPDSKQVDINGVIDFSDCVYTPIVFDLAIAMAYAMLEKSDPIKSVSSVLSGYCSVLQLSEQELDLLYYCVIGRLAQSCINGEHAFQLEPSNEYLLISVRPAWITIQEVLSIGKIEVDKIWREALIKTDIEDC